MGRACQTLRDLLGLRLSRGGLAQLLQRAGDRLVPGGAGRELDQLRRGLPVGFPQLGHAGHPVRLPGLPGLPCGPGSVSQVSRRPRKAERGTQARKGMPEATREVPQWTAERGRPRGKGIRQMESALLRGVEVGRETARLFGGRSQVKERVAPCAAPSPLACGLRTGRIQGSTCRGEAASIVSTDDISQPTVVNPQTAVVSFTPSAGMGNAPGICIRSKNVRT